MRIDGRFIYLDNHTMANIEKMYSWSMDKELISIEAGNFKNIKSSIDIYKKEIMESYIENNHERGASFCHFGIYTSPSNEIVGYVDFQNIKEREEAELSLSIPDRKNRNRTYGFDAFITALEYAFEIRMLRTIIIRTRRNNHSVLNMSKRLQLNGNESYINQNSERIEIIEFRMNNSEYRRIRNLTTA
jgi:RimJ/RimL family protein N-acetyltransferase